MTGIGPLQLSGDDMAKMLDAYQRAANMNLLTSITDKNGNILYVNDLFCKISKFGARELIGKNFRILKSGFHSDAFYDDLWNTIISGKPWQGEILNRAKDGSFFWVDTVILPILDNDGEVMQYLSLRFPITDRKAMEADRLEFTRELHHFVSILSHDLRNPIVGCMAILDVVDDANPPSDKELLDLVKHLKGNVIKLEAYTRNLNDRFLELEKRYARVLGE